MADYDFVTNAIKEKYGMKSFHLSTGSNFHNLKNKDAIKIVSDSLDALANGDYEDVTDLDD